MVRKASFSARAPAAGAQRSEHRQREYAAGERRNGSDTRPFSLNMRLWQVSASNHPSEHFGPRRVSKRLDDRRLVGNVTARFARKRNELLPALSTCPKFGL